MLVAFEKGYSLIPADATGNLAIMRHGATGSQTPGFMSRDARDILVMELSGALELGIGVDSPLLVSSEDAAHRLGLGGVDDERARARVIAERHIAVWLYASLYNMMLHMASANRI
jgi:hypothetical protein